MKTTQKKTAETPKQASQENRVERTTINCKTTLCLIVSKRNKNNMRAPNWKRQTQTST